MSLRGGGSTIDLVKAILAVDLLKKTFKEIAPKLKSYREVMKSTKESFVTIFDSIKDMTKSIKTTKAVQVSKTVGQYAKEQKKSIIDAARDLKSQGLTRTSGKALKIGRGGGIAAQRFYDQSQVTQNVPLSGAERVRELAKTMFDKTAIGKSIIAYKGVKPGMARATMGPGYFGPNLRQAKAGIAKSVASTALAPLTGMFKTIGKVGKGKGKILAQVFKTLGSMALLGTVTMMANLLQLMFPFGDILKTLSDIFGIYGAVISESFMPVIESLYETMLAPDVMAMIQELSAQFGLFFLALIPIGAELLPIGVELLKFGIQILPRLVELLPALTPMLFVFIQGLMLLFEIMSGTMEPIMTVLIGVMYVLGYTFAFILSIVMTVVITLEAIFGGFFDHIMKIIRSFRDSGVWNGVVNIIIGLINTIIGALNLVPYAINAFLHSIGIKDKDVGTIGYIPYLAEGGLVLGPTLAMIGEQGPEMVVPLTGPNANQGRGDVNIYVQGNMYENAVQEVMHQGWIKGVW